MWDADTRVALAMPPKATPRPPGKPTGYAGCPGEHETCDGIKFKNPKRQVGARLLGCFEPDTVYVRKHLPICNEEYTYVATACLSFLNRSMVCTVLSQYSASAVLQRGTCGGEGSGTGHVQP